MFEKRVHVEELLDAGRGSDADVAASLADLRRINRLLGGRRVLRLLLREQAKRLGREVFSLLDVATGSADLAGAVLRWYPRARVAGIDLHSRHLRFRPPPGVGLVCADVWQAPFAPRSFDFVAASLFLHHFTDEELPGCLRKLAESARHAVLVNDLDRHWVPYYFLLAAAPLFARSPITRFDAPASLRRAFARGELEAAAREAGFTRVRERWHLEFRRSLVIELD